MSPECPLPAEDPSVEGCLRGMILSVMPALPPDSELRELVRTAVDGVDPSVRLHAFEVLWGHVRPRLVKTLYLGWNRQYRDPSFAEDVVSDVGKRLLTGKLASYRGEAAVTTWLRQIVSNAAIDAHRRRLRELEHELERPDGTDEERWLSKIDKRAQESIEDALVAEQEREAVELRAAEAFAAVYDRLRELSTDPETCHLAEAFRLRYLEYGHLPASAAVAATATVMEVPPRYVYRYLVSCYGSLAPAVEPYGVASVKELCKWATQNDRQTK